ncbi:MAG: hypothetical protein IID32_09840, partial [Planctomycetes bacterium]|nr:hypothetical protein [Planctomycetota bacterium]
MKSRIQTALFLWIAVLLCGPLAQLQADNWPTWRGPDGTGISAEKDIPIRWSTTENVRWKIALSDGGNSTPIVWGDRVFLTQVSEK